MGHFCDTDMPLRRAAGTWCWSRSAGRVPAVRGEVCCVRGEVCGVLCVLGGHNRLSGGVAAVVRNRGGVRGDEGRAPSAGPAPATAEGPGRWSTSLNTNAFKSGVATSFFGVYDGHGGPAVSKYCAKHLHTELRKHGQFCHGDLTVAIQDTFLRMDQMMRKRKAGKELAEYGGNENWDEYKRAIHSKRFLPSCLQNLPYAGPTSDGCTACVVLIRGNRIFVGNVGDSRCVLSRNDQAIDLCTDHKPNLPAERHRIENAGRAITTSLARGGIPRIDEGIAISRSLGDLQYKNRADLPAERQAMTALPEVRTEDVTHNAQFLIIACDGIWDCMTSQQAVDFVRNYLTANVGLGFICEALLQHCMEEPRGRDNMTVVLVRFKNHLPPLPLPPPPLIPPEDSHGDQEQAAAAAGTNVGGSSSASATPTGL